MKKLLKYWNQNKRKILITVGVIVFIYVCIQIANTIVKKQNEQKAQERQNQINTNIGQATDVTKPKDSVLTQTNLSEKKAEENAKLIKEFVQYCNEKKPEQAYQLLSDACKEELYGTANLFAQNYISPIFKTQKTYELELWAEFDGCSTYKITFLEGNALQTGGSTSSNNFVDYITVVKQAEELKLNVSKLINKINYSNKSGSNKNVEVMVNSRVIFMEYESYYLTVKNRTSKTILLNNGKQANNIYLVDTSQIEYASQIYELPTSNLSIPSQYQRKIKIKFHKVYTANNKVRSMQIKGICLDKEQYDANPNSLETIEKAEIEIKF